MNKPQRIPLSQVDMPEAKMVRNIEKKGNKYVIEAKESVEYSQEQLDAIFLSLIETEKNITSQYESAKVQLEQLQKTVIPNMEKRLEVIKNDKEEIRKHISKEAEKEIKKVEEFKIKKS